MFIFYTEYSKIEKEWHERSTLLLRVRDNDTTTNTITNAESVSGFNDDSERGIFSGLVVSTVIASTADAFASTATKIPLFDQPSCRGAILVRKRW